MEITIYADGACHQNGSWKGGWGYVLLDKDRNQIGEGSGTAEKTTNSRMEIQAVLEGIKAINNSSDITVFTDSMYVVNTINKWLDGWILCNIVNTKANPDQWNEFINLRSKHKSIIAKHVKGHNGDEYNEKCNTLAQAASNV